MYVLLYSSYILVHLYLYAACYSCMAFFHMLNFQMILICHWRTMVVSDFCVPAYLSLSLFVCQHIYPSLFLCASISIPLSLFVCQYIYPSLSFCVPVYLSLSLFLCASIFIPLSLFVCQYIYPSLSFCVPVYLSLSLFLCASISLSLSLPLLLSLSSHDFSKP